MRYFKRVLVFVFATAIAISCEKEQPVLLDNIDGREIVDDTRSKKVDLETLTADSTPIIDDLVAKTGKSSKMGWTYKSGEESLVLDRKNILKITDSVGNTTYSVRAEVPDTPYNVFYNLVAKVEVDGKKGDPMIVRYEIDPDYYPVYIGHERKDAPFQGEVEVFSLEGFIEGISTSGKASLPPPCENHNVKSGNPSTSGGGGGRTSGYNGYGGSSPSGGYASYTMATGSYGNGTTGSVEVGMGSFGAFGTEGGASGSDDADCSDKDRETYKNGQMTTPCSKTTQKAPCPDVKLLLAINEITDVPPSCKSFNFKSINSKWQEASVVNIRFNIVVIEMVAGIRVKKIIPIIFPKPVKFGMPTTFNNRTKIPPGLAAEIGARAINHAIDDVIAHYNNLVLNSTDVIRTEFQNRLKLHFRDYSNGGRVNFNDMSVPTSITQYKTYGIIPDNCY